MEKIGKIIAICNQKDGVGKTVTTVNVVIGMARGLSASREPLNRCGVHTATG